MLEGPSLVDQFVAQSAQRTPDAVALIETQRQATYGELDRLVNKVAHLLVSSGVKRGDRVVIAIDNCIELAAVYFGAMRAGAMAVPLLSGPRSNRLAQTFADCTPRACVVDGATAQAVGAEEPLSRVPTVFVHGGYRSDVDSRPIRGSMRDLSSALDGAPDTAPSVRRVDQDLAAIMYTSGSTGEPRGVMLTHANVASNTRSIVQYLHLSPGDRVMCVLPFCYTYGLSLLQTHAFVGGSVVIDNRFAFPDVVLHAMRTHRVTGFAGVPSTFAILLSKANLAALDCPSLRYVTQAGDAMPAAKILEWCQRVPGVPLYVMYGATEASPRLTYLEPTALHRKLGSIGRPIPNVEIQVMRDDGVPAAAGETGELVARGSNISCGYWNQPDEAHERFGPHGYKTGDLGYVDEEGYLFLEGRRHDMIKTGAHRVGPKEIEEVLHQHPSVGEAAVIGLPHETLGEVPVAFVMLQEGLDAAPETLRVFCGTRLPRHKVPVRFIFRNALPRIGGRDKIDKRALREEAADGFGGSVELQG